MVERIAVVGMACRLPGASSHEALWALLEQGRDEIREVPPDRWSVQRYYDPDMLVDGKCVTRWGGFLDRVQEFDAEFFGITDAEAERVDPQQRLALETAWHALEDAGLPPDALAGTDAGVYMGVSHSDYARILYREIPTICSYDGTGSYQAVTANRISFALNLKGPSMVVDTACSSFLSALHIACGALANGDCPVALCGAVNLNLTPEETIGLTKGGLLSPVGRCKTFEAKADGYVRGEGIGIVVLKRLSDAIADGDRIRGVIRATGVNANGATNGIMAPCGPAQDQLIRRTLDRAGVTFRDIGYVEAHGTGTAIGDTIEFGSIRRVLGGTAGDPACAVSTLKTNVGHLEAASGVAGLIKVLLMFEHRHIPRHVHFEQPLPYLKLAGTRLFIPTEHMPWPSPHDAPRLATVSAFGFGGANGFAVVEEPPRRPVDQLAPRSHELLPISARSREALAAAVEAHAHRLSELSSSEFPSYCHAARNGRSHLPWRTAIVARDRESACAGLEALEPPAEAANGENATVGLLVDGMGAAEQTTCFDDHELFRSTLAQLLGSSDTKSQSDTERAAHLALAKAIALAETLRSFGVAIRFVAGSDRFARLAALGVLQVLDFPSAVRLLGPMQACPEQLPARIAELRFGKPRGKLLPARSDWAEAAFYVDETPSRIVRQQAITELHAEAKVVLVWSPDGEVLTRELDQRGGRRSLCLRNTESQAGVERLLATLYAAGLPVAFRAYDQGRSRQVVDLPLYPFQRKPHWVRPYAPKHPPADGVPEILLRGTAEELYGAVYR